MQNFKRRSELPNQKIRLNIDNQILTEIAIDVLNAHNVRIYCGTLESGYDKNYPYLLWDHDQLTQVAAEYSRTDLVDCCSLEAFFSYFFESTRKTKDIRISDQYTATVMADKIVVGCQTIDFDTVKQVYDAMLELRNQK